MCFFLSFSIWLVIFFERLRGEFPTYFLILINKRKYKRATYTRGERRGREAATTTTATVRTTLRAKSINTRQPGPKEKGKEVQHQE